MLLTKLDNLTLVNPELKSIQGDKFRTKPLSTK